MFKWIKKLTIEKSDKIKKSTIEKSDEIKIDELSQVFWTTIKALERAGILREKFVIMPYDGQLREWLPIAFNDELAIRLALLEDHVGVVTERKISEVADYDDINNRITLLEEFLKVEFIPEQTTEPETIPAHYDSIN